MAALWPSQAGAGRVSLAGCLILGLALSKLPGCSASTFKSGQKVPVYVNKVGPYFNTHETYHYYSLPVCHPNPIVSLPLKLGQVLNGDRMAESLYDIKFKEDVGETQLCSVSLSNADIDTFINAIEELYYFEMFVAGDLPVRGFVGQLEETMLPSYSHTVFLWTHLHFDFEYNGNQIVGCTVSEKKKEAQLPTEPPQNDGELTVTFTYSASWKETKLAYSKRHTKDMVFFPKTLEIHWLSIINSAVLVVLLVGFVSLILNRMLNKDFAKYSREDDDLDMDDEIQEDQGWKNLHTDVFRFPEFKSLLCAMLGSGCQFLALCLGLVLMALCGMFNVHHHGSLPTAFVFLYALTSGISGYVSNRFYQSIEGDSWVWNIVITSSVFTVPFFVTWSVVNSVAWYMGSTQALPYTTIILLILIWLCVGFPLTVLGGILGKNAASTFDAPCRTNNAPREIPEIPLYKSAFAHMVVGGFLPFSSVSVELYYIFATVWGRERYTLYGILFMVLLILLIVTACIAVALTYFQLSSEDHRWWWRAMFSSGSTGFFVFFYSIFYFNVRSNMDGPLQTVQFFGFTMLACYVFFLTLGTVGFFSSLCFVRYIYNNLKID
jgi:transmembrane 9 superfamily protein 1